MKLILNIYEILKMKKTIGLLIFLIAVFQVLGCSFPEKTNFQSSTPENKPINSMAESPTPVNKPANIAEENFAKEWKSKFEAIAAELERNRRLWQENKIVNYDFVVGKFAGGVTNLWNASPVLIKVREGKKNSIEALVKGKDFRIDSYENIDTIDKLFNYMRQELDDGKIIEAKYDKKLGYPKSVFVTFTFAFNHNYRTISISKFEIIR